MGLPKRRVEREFAPGDPVTPSIRVGGVLYYLKRGRLNQKGGVVATYALK